MKPAEASEECNAPFVQDHPSKSPDARTGRRRYAVNDEVRIAVSKAHFEKGLHTQLD